MSWAKKTLIIKCVWITQWQNQLPEHWKLHLPPMVLFCLHDGMKPSRAKLFCKVSDPYANISPSVVFICWGAIEKISALSLFGGDISRTEHLDNPNLLGEALDKSNEPFSRRSYSLVAVSRQADCFHLIWFLHRCRVAFCWDTGILGNWPLCAAAVGSQKPTTPTQLL